MKKKILYAGDSWEGGPANYLLGILRRFDADFLHVPSAVRMLPELIEKPFDAVILSDYPRSLFSQECEEILVRKIFDGCSLLMVGGWASFAGPFGGWHNSLVEGLLPVTCLQRDDRINVAAGAYMEYQKPHPMFDSFSFDPSPVLCGFNEVTPKPSGTVILNARKIMQQHSRNGKFSLSLDAEAYPLFVIGEEKGRRTAALTTDVAPHWCGGLVDWGSRREKIPVNPKIDIEVGDQYIEFLTRILHWLTRAV